MICGYDVELTKSPDNENEDQLQREYERDCISDCCGLGCKLHTLNVALSGASPVAHEQKQKRNRRVRSSKS